MPALARASRRADLLHVHGDAAGALALPLLAVCPSVLTTHGLNLSRRLHGPRRAVWDRCLSSVAHASSAIICTSETERDELVPVLRQPDRHKLIVVRNGVDSPSLPAGDSRVAIREELGIDSGTLLGLFVGELDKNKAPLVAAAGAVEASSRGTRVILAVAGDGPERKELMELRHPAVRVLGYRDDVKPLLAAADVFVHTSEREGVPFSLLEAMIRGLPIVATSGIGTSEVVGDAAMVVPLGDSDALAAALIRLGEDQPMRAALGRRAHDRAREIFGVERFLTETQTVYEGVLGSSDADREP
jgi:glycosyltransferase involved in cell wall biosynthesis